jgi:HK97 family phage portal protein
VIGRLLTRAEPPVVYTVVEPPPVPEPAPQAAPLPQAPPPMVLPPVMWPTDTYGLGYCSEAGALDLPVVSAALGLVCSLILQMPLNAVTGSTVIEPTPIILRNPVPAPGRALGDWLCEVVLDVTLHGNYVAVLADPGSSGWPEALYGVPFGQWAMLPDGTYQIGQTRYAPGEVFHVRKGCRTGEMVGRGLMETHPKLLAACVAAERFASQYFTSGIAPPTVLTHPDSELSQEGAEHLKAKFRVATTRREAVVVPNGTTITALTSDADKAQLAETRRWNAVNLAIAMGVPPVLLGLEAPSLTYRNLGEVYQEYLSSTVMGLLVPIEQQLTAQVLARGVEARFDTRAVLRPDIAGRVDLAIKALGAGLMSRTEARSIIDLPPDIGAPDAFAGTDVPLTLVPEEETGS